MIFCWYQWSNKIYKEVARLFLPAFVFSFFSFHITWISPLFPLPSLLFLILSPHSSYRLYSVFSALCNTIFPFHLFCLLAFFPFFHPSRVLIHFVEMIHISRGTDTIHVFRDDVTSFITCSVSFPWPSSLVMKSRSALCRLIQGSKIRTLYL